MENKKCSKALQHLSMQNPDYTAAGKPQPPAKRSSIGNPVGGGYVCNRHLLPWQSAPCCKSLSNASFSKKSVVTVTYHPVLSFVLHRVCRKQGDAERPNCLTTQRLLCCGARHRRYMHRPCCHDDCRRCRRGSRLYSQAMTDACGSKLALVGIRFRAILPCYPTGRCEPAVVDCSLRLPSAPKALRQS